NLSLSNLKEGEYEFRFTATSRSGKSDSDEVKIKVKKGKDAGETPAEEEEEEENNQDDEVVVTPAPDVDAVQGLLYSYYEFDSKKPWSKLPDLKKLQPKKKGTVGGFTVSPKD